MVLVEDVFQNVGMCEPESKSTEVLGYDMIFIPVILAWDLTGGAVQAMGWVSPCFWSIDMFFTCLTGYYVNGELEMRPRKIVSHYVRTWFPMDLLVLVVDWVGVALNASSLVPVGCMLTLVYVRDVLAVFADAHVGGRNIFPNQRSHKLIDCHYFPLPQRPSYKLPPQRLGTMRMKDPVPSDTNYYLRTTITITYEQLL